ncbi:MAG: hypothetical protein DCF15_05850 [Phormidesmis priestleyi]|uniref:Uncharacterized protein n=1 Tax=Phormidesmis priestleyi TaxID=268141 RepID=A0A2W4XUE3_9CYAN|nr:MAG: hypothetical protein DCF15_05850 [Phormidesmis priestleyi]
MTERLDRIEAQQAANTANIADLITLSGNVLRAVDGLTVRIDESNQRFEILRSEAIARQQRSDQRFEESNRRFEAMQETLQRLFLELHSTNGAVAGLSDRVDNLEQAS